MSQQMSLERLIADWMTEEASGVAADQLVNQIITTTRRQRPRPRWLASLQESPMHAQARVVVGSPTRRLTFAVALLVLAALVAAGIAGAFLLQPKSTADDWPGFRGDPSRVGLSTLGPIGNPVSRWTFQADGAISSNVSVAGEFALVPSDDGILHALSLTDGTERWSFRAAAPMRGPLAIGGRVYVADGTGTIHALELADGRNVWTAPIALESTSDIAILDGRLYVGTGDGRLVALDASNGAELWRVQVSPGGLPVRAPAAADGLVVAATDDAYLTALDPSTGKVRWSVAVVDDGVGTPIIVEDAVYIGASADTETGQLVAVSAADGSERWRLDESLFAPSVANGIGYSGSAMGTVAAVDLASGAVLWRTMFDGVVRAPAVAGEVVYISADRERQVVALDRATGGELWRSEVDGPNDCCIAAARGLVFVGTALGTVYAIGGDGATLVAKAPVTPASQAPEPSARAGSSSPAPADPTLETSVAWATDAPDGAIPWGLALAPDSRLWTTEGFDDRFAIYTAEGEFVERWGDSGSGSGQFDFTRSNGDAYGMVAFAPDGSFYVLDAGNRRIQHFDKDRTFVGTWGEFGSGPGQFNDPISIAVDDDGVVYVLDDVRGMIESYDAEGTVLETIPAFPAEIGPSDGANQLAVGPDGHYFVSVTFPNVVIELDRDGNLLTTYGAADSGEGAFTEQPNVVAFDSAGRRYVTQGPGRGDHPGVQVFAPDGTYLGGFGSYGAADADLGFPVGLVVTADGIFVTDASGVGDIGLRSAIRKFEPIAFP